ncbi:snoRNA-binding rRNA-processing protein utp10 [Elasticomyces elasticus]|nr:snoRNA-binding rRNA-processing protein utp10 [Elasticomyces elasticus]
MATVLQQQLAAIAAKTTNQLDLKAQKAAHSKSLLFETSTAAGQTFDTLYQICYEGFQELCALDGRFANYGRNIFSEQSKREERTQMTSKENEELDLVLRNFLGLVSGRLLLKPGLKAVEWLVRRFRYTTTCTTVLCAVHKRVADRILSVHEYNTDWLILSFLPYHATQIFPTLLSILPKTLSPAFKFLHPYMTTLQNPPRHAILYAAINNPSFFSSFNHYALSVTCARQHSTALLGFWAGITAQAINGLFDNVRSGRTDVQRQREEDLLLRIIPIIQEALSISHVPELFVGSCMIITILASKGSLEDKVIDGLMDALVKSWSPRTVDEGLACLAVMAEERHNAMLPVTSLKAVLRLENLDERLTTLSEQQKSDKLILSVALGAIGTVQGSRSQRTRLVISIVQKIIERRLLPTPRVKAVLRALLGLAQKKDDLVPISAEDGTQVAELIHHMYMSAEYRAVVEETIREADVSIEDLEMRLQVTLQRANVPASPDNGDTVTNKNGRPKSISQFVPLVQSLPSSMREASFLQAKDYDMLGRLTQAFIMSLRSPGNIAEFLSLPLIQKDEGLSSAVFFSLLARIWTSSSPILARITALRIAKDRLSATELGAVDLQALMPYVLSALGDSSDKVRRNAADFALAMKHSYKATGEKSKLPKDIKIWAKDTLYGSKAKNLEWLTSADAFTFLSDAILPTLEECVLDSSQIGHVVADTLNGHSHTARDGAVPRRDLKSALRSAVFLTLSSHVAETPLYRVRLCLLTMLNRVGKAGAAARTAVLTPAVTEWASLPVGTAASICEAESIEISALDHAFLGCLTSRTQEELLCLQSIASGRVGARSELAKAAFARLGQLWPRAKLNAQNLIAHFLLDYSLLESPDSLTQTRQAEALHVLRSVQMSTEILASFVDGLPDVSSMQERPPPAKRRRTSRSETSKPMVKDVSQLQAAIRRITVVLELVDGSKPESHPSLLKGLFHVLGELQHYKVQLSSDLVYVQGVAIGILLSIVDALKATPNAKIDRAVIRADLVVECIRSTSSTQVHNAALLLISSLATWAPDLVLHSVMPIFTFMSTTLLRQSDDYSAHVIDQTISRVIPPLAASLRKQNQDLVVGASELLSSFTAAFEHIPLHRRLRLFTHLTETLGPTDCLHAVIAMLVEKYPTDSRVPQFVADLLNHFDPQTGLTAAAGYIDILCDSLQPKRSISDTVLDFKEKTAEYIAGSVERLLITFASLLKDRSYRAKLVRDLSQQDEVAEVLRTHFGTVLEKAMVLSSDVASRDNFHGPQSAASGLLSALLGLLPTTDFVKSAAPLLSREDDNLRRKVVQSLEARIRTEKSSHDATRLAILDFLPHLTSIVQRSADVPLRHISIVCLDQASEKYGKKDTNRILTVAKIVTSDQALGSADNRLRIISLLCLASMVEVLREDFISLLPQALARAFDYIEATIKANSPNEKLYEAAFTFITAILEYLPYMVSRKYLDTLLVLSFESAEAGLSDEADETRLKCYQLIAKKVRVQECFSALDHRWSSASKLGVTAAEEYIGMLRMLIDFHPKSVIIRHAQILFTIFLNAYDFRRLQGVDNDGVDVDKKVELDATESLINAAALEMTLKLNDATFRPFFVRLVEWASDDLHGKDRNGRMLRAISLFGFLTLLFEKLRSIVTNYSGYILDYAVNILEHAVPDTEERHNMLRVVLQTLSSSFKHDQDDFWQTPAHLSTIAAPLLAQLGNAAAFDVSEDLIPAITDLAAAAASPEHHKELNATIMKHMRSDDTLIRLAAVKCEQSLTERLGEDWLALLPEMLPFISELQEDDNETVERETAKWIRSIEEILGESLEGMLQ